MCQCFLDVLFADVLVTLSLFEFMNGSLLFLLFLYSLLSDTLGLTHHGRAVATEKTSVERLFSSLVLSVGNIWESGILGFSSKSLFCFFRHFFTMSVWKAVIITGASRGYGRAIALAFARAATANLHFVLSGRDESGLAQTQNEVAALGCGHAIDFTIVPANLSQTEGLERASEGIFGQVTLPADRQYEEIVFVNNAGSLGPLAPVGSGQYTAASFADVMHVNVTAACFLTSELIRRYAPFLHAHCLTSL